MNRKMFVGVVSALALALAACGGSSNPTSPSSASSASTGQSGATISGSVSGSTSGSSAGYTKLDATNGITVTISGTSLTVAVDSQGKFTFTGVPAGSVTLVFSAGGQSATLTLNGVQATDKITVHVTIKGTTASLDDEQRNGATMTELEDRITALNPAGAGTLTVGSTTVSVPGTATIRHGDTAIAFGDLHVGDRVHVRGAMSPTQMVATEVMVQNTNTNVGVNANGTISGLKGTCPSIEFVVGGWQVYTNSSTNFQDKTGCSAVTSTSTVHVKGDVQAGGKVLATWVQVQGK